MCQIPRKYKKNDEKVRLSVINKLKAASSNTYYFFYLGINRV